MVDLMFRDESHHVIKKAITARKRPRRPRQSAGLDDELASTDPTTLPSPSRSSTSSSPSTSGSAFTTTLIHQPRPFLGLSGPHVVDGPASAGDGDADASGDDLDDSDPTFVDDSYHGSRALAAKSASSTSRIPLVLTTSLQERGVAFFFARYVATDHGCYQNYDFIYDVWKPPSSVDVAETNDCILASMTAVGLTGLSKLTRSPEAMMRARQSYVLALRLANQALRDPVEAVKDSTMLAVLILGTYEFVSGRTPQTIRAWQEHVSGAAALASMRGAAQFRTNAGTRMFIMLCHTVLISCVRSGLPMPQTMVDLRNELWNLTDTRGPIWRVCRHAIQRSAGPS